MSVHTPGAVCGPHVQLYDDITPFGRVMISAPRSKPLYSHVPNAATPAEWWRNESIVPQFISDSCQLSDSLYGCGCMSRTLS